MAVTLPVRGTALLLIDVVNDLAFPGSDALIEQAEPMATRLASFKRRATAAVLKTMHSASTTPRSRRCSTI
jgi:nicotinamidase-related amidase